MSEVKAVNERMRPVYIGRHQVGQIPESEWLFIVAEVRANPAIWKAQARNLLRTVSRTLGLAFISVPLGVFWTAAALGWLGKPVFFPGPGEHIGAMLGHPEIVAAGIALAVAAMLSIGIKLGYVNFFAKAESALVKEHLGLDEPGDCSVR